MTIYRAPVNCELYGSIEEGQEIYHEMVMYEGNTFDIELEADDEEVDLDFYIADRNEKIIYKDEKKDSGASAVLEVGTTGIFTLVIKAVDGDTDYVLKISEHD